ncbi:hypothetical protein FRC17_005719 [Serendipita sp. 399]|nr:hypothetical protein FRC17_005719 [Serendipita sp. 399]
MSAAAVVASFRTFPSGVSVTSNEDLLPEEESELDQAITLGNLHTVPLPLSTTTSKSGAVPVATANASSSSSAPLSSITPVSADSTAVSSNSSGSSSSKTPVAAVVGIILGLLVVIVPLVFAIRYYFIRKRQSKMTPARARVSRLVISPPSNFQHLSSGAHPHLQQQQQPSFGNTLGTATGMRADMRVGPSSGSSQRPAPTKPPAGGNDVDGVESSPYDRIKQKYSFDLNQLETGLSDHMETMKSSRKPPPVA